MDYSKMTDVDVAAAVLAEKGSPMDFKELILEVIRLKKKPVQSEAEAISEIYTQINMESKFQYVGGRDWGLTEWNPPEIKKSRSTGSSSARSKAKEDAAKNHKKKLEDIQIDE